MKRIADLYPGVRGIDFLLQLITVMFFRTEMISVSSFVITNDVQGHRLHDNLTTGDGLIIPDLFSTPLRRAGTKHLPFSKWRGEKKKPSLRF